MKTPFSLNGYLYKQIDGVAMGSPLGPTLANIIMTALEEDIVKKLIDANIIKFYVCYVDNMLVLMKPTDIPIILKQLNSNHPQIKFTNEEFVDNNITSSGTTIFHKCTHTGQYIHLSSFTPWSRKTAWIRSLIHSAQKICSNTTLLSDEIQNI